MKLSVITINYNNLYGLKKTIESVLSQVLQPFEYILVDGGSTDGSKEYIELIGAENPGLSIKWVSEPDNGIYHAMNKGLKMANGDYVQFLNSGDYLTGTHTLENFLAAGDGQHSVYYGNMVKLFAGRKVRDKGFAGRKPSMFDFYKGTLNHAPTIIKKDLFEKYGVYDEKLRLVADWKWFLEAIVIGGEKIKYIDTDIVCFDMNGESNQNYGLCLTERNGVLNALLPGFVLNDYKQFASAVTRWQRLQRYPATKLIMWAIERFLFRYEKIKSSIKKETQVY
ncbi:MAG: glycosyltransferase [Bacteroidales bacterium]|nr:glycosyltransferase [Bacteroidales bacterium]